MRLGKLYFINKKISDINGDLVLKETTTVELRKLAEILIIDDNEFVFINALKKHEFNIEAKIDIQSIKDVEAYDIILCDIRGVGKFLCSDFEGAYLIKQIKEKYPTKIVIAYTANDYDATYNKFLSYADAVVSKGMSLEDWSSLLDDKLKESADPVMQWKRIRDALLQAGVDIVRTAEIESKYVKAIQDNSFESLEKMYHKMNNNESKIIQALLSSVIAKIIS